MIQFSILSYTIPPLTRADDLFYADKILEFLEINKFPLVTVMTELNSVKVYSSTKKLQVLFHLLYVYEETKMRKKKELKC